MREDVLSPIGSHVNENEKYSQKCFFFFKNEKKKMKTAGHTVQGTQFKMKEIHAITLEIIDPTDGRTNDG